ncbi:MAG TPA: methylmalonyl-CoA epimerase [bacterium]|jgi:methylmalonyl-CoA epimerase
MLTGLHHIGIAVMDLEDAVRSWETMSGGQVVHREFVESQGVEVAVIEIGSLRVELLKATREDSPIARFISANGTGIHHLALESTSVEEELTRMKASGVRLIDEKPRAGAENTSIGFVHPRALHGVLTEVVERKLK